MGKPGRKCTACAPDKRDDVNRNHVDGASFRDNAGQTGLSKSAVHRHVQNHLPETLMSAQMAGEVADADSLLAQAQQLLSDAKTIHAEAMGAFDHRTALSAIREQARVLDLLGRLLGELGSGTAVHLHAHRHEHAIEMTPEHIQLVATELARDIIAGRVEPPPILVEAVTAEPSP